MHKIPTYSLSLKYPVEWGKKPKLNLRTLRTVQEIKS